MTSWSMLIAAPLALLFRRTGAYLYFYVLRIADLIVFLQIVQEFVYEQGENGR